METTVQAPGSAPGTAPEPVEGKKKTPKVKAAKPEGEVTGENGEPKEVKPKRERRARYPDEHVITILVPNPKHGKCAARFDQYRDGMTIKEYVEIMSKEPFNWPTGLIWADIWWDTDPKRKLIHVGPTVVDKPPPPPPKEPKPKKVKKEKPEVVAGTEHHPAA